MAATEIKVQMQQRRDTAAGWTSVNPVLLSGELGYETNTGYFKIGDGSTAWNSLAYMPESKITSYPLDTDDLGTNSVTSTQIASGAVDTSELANNSVTGDKLANDITIANDLTVTDDLTVNGTTIILESVGIGTSVPATILHAYGSYPTIKVENNNTAQYASASIELQGPAGAERITKLLHGNSNTGGTETYFKIEQYDSNGTFVKTLSNYDYQFDFWSFNTAGSERIRIDSSGNVGIATSSPSANLHISASNSGECLRLSHTDVASYYSLGRDSSGNLRINDSTNGELIRIQPGGNVGIGTTSPTEKLTINGNIEFESNTQSIKFAAGNSATNSIEVNSGSGPRASIDFLGVGSNQVTDIVFKTSETSSTSAERMRIKTSSGNIGIGTTSPAVDLDVNGEIRASTGILFGTDTAAANTLDDYEEGTWTPGIEGASTAGSYTFTSTGAYTKVGNKVTVWGELTNITTVSAGSGITRVTGLPFTNPLGFDAIGSILLDQWDLSSTSYIHVVAQVVNNANYMQPRIVRDGATDIGLQITDKTNDSADITFCITYTVA